MTSNGKVAVITGAGSGIGRSAALHLFKDGYSVALAGRRLEPLEESISLAGVDDARAIAVPTDVGDTDAIANLFEETKKAFGREDVLFNNAGIGSPRMPIDELPVEDWKRVVDTNLTGSFVCAQHAIRMMKEQSPQGGRIINNGSISAYVPRPEAVAYTATKHAITGLTKQISLDGRPFDIVCSQGDVGNAATPMTARMANGVPQANGEMAVEPTYNVDHVGETISYISNLPLEANIQFVTIMASKIPYIGRG